MMKLSKLILLVGICLSLIACGGSSKRAIEIEPDQADKNPKVTDNPIDAKNTAAIRVKIEETAFDKYLDFAKPVIFKFSYFSVNKQDTLQFSSGVSFVEVSNLQVGVAGPMSLVLLQDDKEILKGVIESKILVAGDQPIVFDFQVVEDADNPSETPDETPDTDTPDTDTPDTDTPDVDNPDVNDPPDVPDSDEAEVSIDITILE